MGIYSSYHPENRIYEDFTTAIQTTVSLLTTCTLILAASAKRQFAIVQNISVSSVQISLQNSTATITNGGFKLTADNNLRFDRETSNGVYTGAIYGKAPTAGRLVSVIYFNRVS